jgi:hypothetical protein
VGLFSFLNKLFSKDKVEVRYHMDFQSKSNSKPQNYDAKYVEPKRTENYTNHELIPLTAWVVDVKADNPDGTNRQEILAKCAIGDELTFRLLEYKPGYYDIEVHTQHGCIGLMSISELQKMARYILNGGVMHNAKISILKQPKTKRGKIECTFTFERNKMR